MAGRLGSETPMTPQTRQTPSTNKDSTTPLKTSRTALTSGSQSIQLVWKDPEAMAIQRPDLTKEVLPSTIAMKKVRKNMKLNRGPFTSWRRPLTSKRSPLKLEAIIQDEIYSAWVEYRDRNQSFAVPVMTWRAFLRDDLQQRGWVRSTDPSAPEIWEEGILS